MNKIIITIILGLIAIVKLDFILYLSYWDAFQVGIKIVVLALPVIVFVGIIFMLHSKYGKKKKAKRKQPIYIIQSAWSAEEKIKKVAAAFLKTLASFLK